MLADLLRKEGDSNPRYAFDVYTLSRRASSATRAPFLFLAEAETKFSVAADLIPALRLQRYCFLSE